MVGLHNAPLVCPFPSDAVMKLNGQFDFDWVELPTKVLMHMFSCLSVWDLLRGPAGVCRRWREVALEPALWRHRSYSNKYELSNRRPFLNALLSAAPRLHSLECLVSLMDTEGLELFSNTSCAVRDLTVESRVDSCGALEDVDVERWERVVLRQVALGRLDALRLRLERTCALRIVHAIGDAQLTQLEMQMYCDDVELSKVPPSLLPRQASLKRLLFRSGTDPVLEHLLETNAAVLEEVRVWSFCTKRALELVGKCPRLQTVELLYDDTYDFRVLEQCARLRSLTIVVWENWIWGWEDDPLLLPYIRQATALTELCVESRRTDVVVAVVQALASSGRSALQELRLVGKLEDDALRQISAALAGLPRLCRLRIRNDTSPARDIYLDAINPFSVPSLRLFELNFKHSANLAALHSLVLRNPDLHVMDIARQRWSIRGANCTSCPTGRHCEVRGAKRSLFGHSPSVACDLEEHRNSNENWVWVGAASVSRGSY